MHSLSFDPDNPSLIVTNTKSQSSISMSAEEGFSAESETFVDCLYDKNRILLTVNFNGTLVMRNRRSSPTDRLAIDFLSLLVTVII